MVGVSVLRAWGRGLELQDALTIFLKFAKIPPADRNVPGWG